MPKEKFLGGILRFFWETTDALSSSSSFIESLITEIFPSFKMLISFCEKISIDSFGDFKEEVLYWSYDFTLSSEEDFLSWFCNLVSPIAEGYLLSFFTYVFFKAVTLPRVKVPFNSTLLFFDCWMVSGFYCFFNLLISFVSFSNDSSFSSLVIGSFSISSILLYPFA